VASLIESAEGTRTPDSTVTARPGIGRLRDEGWAAMLFIATRVVQLLVLAWMAPAGTKIGDKLLSWDGGWFLNVAEQGYPHGFAYDASGAVTGNGLAFFPLYPMLIRGLAALGPSYASSAIVITALAGLAGAVVIFELGRVLADDGRLGEAARRRPKAVGYALVVLVYGQPMSVVFSMGYTEGLFVALVAGALLAAYRRSWLFAGLLGVLAGLTRPTGAAVAVALAVAAAARIADPEAGRRERAAASIAGLAALASVPAYILWVGERVGHPGAWFTIQTSGWGSTFDFGSSTWQFITSTLKSSDGFVPLSVVAIVIAATIALIRSLCGPGWLPLRVYGVIAFVMVVCESGFYHSKPRLLVPALVLLVPAAIAASRARPRMAALWLAVYALAGFWYGAYMLMVWPYAI
jgi:Gpi18-like mannosyltransferase